MPETRIERLFFVAGLILIAILAGVIVVVKRPAQSGAKPVTNAVAPQPEPTTTARPPVGTAATTTPVAPAPPPAATRRTPTRPTPTTTQAANALRLQLTARRDTWISVRRGSSSGTLLFEGTLPAGSTRSFTAAAFSVRFGAAANVRATLDGHTLALPSGTYSASIGAQGVGPRSA